MKKYRDYIINSKAERFFQRYISEVLDMDATGEEFFAHLDWLGQVDQEMKRFEKWFAAKLPEDDILRLYYRI